LRCGRSNPEDDVSDSQIVGRSVAPSGGECSPDRLVASFERNARESVLASLRIYKGRPIADVRVHYRAADGVLHPTSKGLSVARSLLPELEAAVIALRQAADEERAA
jgi:hypothetical protein